MSNVEALKEQARRHEQREEWEKACELYLKAIDRLDDEQSDPGLYNRVGDILIKVGSYDSAVEHFEKATDLYLETELPNNAIAVCKKVIRHLPNRHESYLRMGRIRASQGFTLDAWENFRTYAERVHSAGDAEEALRALTEFVELAPQDAQVRLSVVQHLLQHERAAEALDQLVAGYRSALRQGDDEGARDLGVKILELDPDVDLDALAGPESEAESFTFEPTALAGAEQDPDGEGTGDNVVSVPGSPHSDFDGDFGDHQEGGGFAEIRDALETGEEAGGPGSGSHPAAHSEADQQDFQEITFDDLGFGEDSHPVEEDEADPLPLVYPDEGGPGLEGAGFDVDPGLVDQDLSGSLEAAWEDASDEGSEALHAQWVRLRDECRRVPKDLELAQQLVELSFRLGDKDSLVASYLTLAGCLEETGQVERSESVLRQAMALDPDHPEVLRALHGLREKPPEAGVSDDAGGFVDLASLILGEDRKEKTTRFRVAYEEPSGDEEADFARMLTQFKEKVAESFDAADVRAHHDLGTAYKEMGLLDEAVEKFQAALRASPVHLPSYELLGQTFFEKGEYTAAVRVLERALRVSTDVADDFIGIYYYLARAHEELGSNDRAVEYYDHVFALDINFMDVTERLRALR